MFLCQKFSIQAQNSADFELCSLQNRGGTAAIFLFEKLFEHAKNIRSIGSNNFKSIILANLLFISNNL